MMSTLTVTKENFNEEVAHSAVPVLLDFWAPWCGPCKMLSPTIEKVAEEAAGAFKVGKVNVDEQPELADAFHVRSIPTLAVVKNGTVVNTSVGLKSKAAVLAMLTV